MGTILNDKLLIITLLHLRFTAVMWLEYISQIYVTRVFVCVCVCVCHGVYVPCGCFYVCLCVCVRACIFTRV